MSVASVGDLYVCRDDKGASLEVRVSVAGSARKNLMRKFILCKDVGTIVVLGGYNCSPDDFFIAQIVCLFTMRDGTTRIEQLDRDDMMHRQNMIKVN